MVVNVWNYKTKFKVASNKIACKVKGIAFSRDGTYFVTVGNRHVKFWYLTVSSLMETVPLKGRAAILGDLKNNYFCDVACGSGENSLYTYAITTNGILCEFNENRCLSRATELHIERAYCIYADEENLFIGGSNGTILIFRQTKLDFVASLPRPHYLGVDISKGHDTSHIIENMNNRELKYPDCVALCYDKYDLIISAIYNDHSFYVWDIKDLNKVKKLDSHLFHSSWCWSLDTFSSSFHSSGLRTQQVDANMPMDSFITCSTDNTVRIWSTNSSCNPNMSRLHRNIYSKELLKIIYIDNDLSALCEVDQSVDISDPSSSKESSGAASQPQATCKTSTDMSSQMDASKLGSRCLKISPFGRHLATGDRNGNIRIYDLASLDSICMIEAHNTEVLYLQYSPPESGRQLLASSSRDRLIHIFDASRSTYDLLQTLDDHSAAITAVRFSFSAAERQLYVISCGADKSIMFRTASTEANTFQLSASSSSSNNSSTASSPNHLSHPEYSNFVRTSYVAEKQTFYDLNIDSAKGQVNTISQDRMIRTYSIKDGKKLRQFRGSLNEDGYLLKMDVDRSGQLLATSCTDKCVYVWDLNTCECLAYICGHSEVVTDLKFTSDNQHLITVSGDGCLFLWKLNNLHGYLSNPVNPTPTGRTSHLRHSMANLNTCSQPLPQPASVVTQQSFDTIFDNDHSQLPAWARNKLSNVNVSSETPTAKSVWSTTNSVEFCEQSTTASNQTTTRRTGRAVWGTVLNTSFAVAIDSELNNINSPTSSSIEAFKVVEENEEHDTKAKSFAKTDLHTFKNSLDNCIQFPSPSVDKDTYQVKQVSFDSESVVAAVSVTTTRPSWICNNNEDDLLFNLHKFKTEDSSDMSDELEELVKSPSNAVGDTPAAQLVTPANSKEFYVEEEFSNDYSKILSGSTDLAHLVTPARKILPTDAKGLIDSLIKLDCDMDNSFRRQSISARYLLRTAQQKQKLNNQEIEALSLTPQFKVNLKLEDKENLVVESATSVVPGSKPKADLDKQSSEPQRQTSAQLVDLFKMRRKTTSISNPTPLASGTNFQLLYSHHTESSLNKTKPKQPQQFHSSNNLNREQTSSQQSSAGMKRSPSVSSIAEAHKEQSSSSCSSSSASSSTSSIKLTAKSISAKSSPVKQSTILASSNHFENEPLTSSSSSSSSSVNSHSPSNLKKAFSMNSLFSSQPAAAKTPAITTAQSSSNRANTSNKMFAQPAPPPPPPPQAVSARESPTVIAGAPLNTVNPLLPPKTVRQVKQRSAERQYTTGGVLTHINYLNKASSNNLITVNTFSEQNKHLRKLSNSIQNLHQQSQVLSPSASHTANLQKLMNPLPPQAPRSPLQHQPPPSSTSSKIKSESDEEKQRMLILDYFLLKYF